jgi:hypothetical protein
MNFSLKVGIIINLTFAYFFLCSSVSTEYENYLLENFLHTSILKYCGTQDENCIAFKKHEIRSAKVAHFLQKSTNLTKDISEILGPEWTEQLQLEGHIGLFLDKIELLQNYADDPNVEMICEIGFNAGHSMLNFLVSNPIAKIIVFDNYIHQYSSIATISIQYSFPTRDFIHIVGDSQLSVPSWKRTFYSHIQQQKCNLIFIDGGHLKSQLIDDIMNMKDVANMTYHRVIVDDLQSPELDLAVHDLVLNGTLKVIEVVNNIPHTNFIEWDAVSSDSLLYKFQVSSYGEPRPPSTVAVVEYR